MSLKLTLIKPNFFKHLSMTVSVRPPYLLTNVSGSWRTQQRFGAISVQCDRRYITRVTKIHQMMIYKKRQTVVCISHVTITYIVDTEKKCLIPELFPEKCHSGAVVCKYCYWQLRDHSEPGSQYFVAGAFDFSNLLLCRRLKHVHVDSLHSTF